MQDDKRIKKIWKKVTALYRGLGYYRIIPKRRPTGRPWHEGQQVSIPCYGVQQFIKGGSWVNLFVRDTSYLDTLSDAKDFIYAKRLSACNSLKKRRDRSIIYVPPIKDSVRFM